MSEEDKAFIGWIAMRQTVECFVMADADVRKVDDK